MVYYRILLALICLFGILTTSGQEKGTDLRNALSDKRLAVIETKLDNLDSRLIEVRNDGRETRQEIREARQDSQSHFQWILGTVLVAVLIPVIERVALRGSSKKTSESVEQVISELATVRENLKRVQNEVDMLRRTQGLQG